MLFDDKLERTVRLLVKQSEGRWVTVDGAPLPQIAKEALAELILSADDIVDAGVREDLSKERRVPFLDQGTPIWARVDGGHVPRKLAGRATARVSFPNGSITVVQITLQEDLQLILRPNKDAKLADCRCKIPALNTEAKSLNHAYTLISTKFEPHRRSHSGNVFHRVYYETKHRDKEYLRPLGDLRTQTELNPQRT